MSRARFELVAIVLALVLAAAGLCCTGCASRSQLQVVADARETALAVKQAPPAKVPAIAAALADDVLAATAHVPDLPKPTHTAAEIIADPAVEAKPAAASVASPPPYVAPQPAHVDPLAALLETIGYWLVRVGAAVSGLALGLFLASLWPFLDPWITPWALLIEEAGIGGVASVLLGSGLTWLGEHAWLIYVSGGVVLAVYLVRHRACWMPVARRLFAVHRPVAAPIAASTPFATPVAK